jgi:2,4-dienoyl-CoA reductase (NADPH2)
VLEHVWQPGRIGALELPHRLVMGSMHMGLESIDPDGSMLAAFYAERAAGGAALIVTGGSAVSRVGAGGVSYSFINEDAEAEKLAAIPAAVHAAGGRVLLQLFHAGRYAFEKSFGLPPVAPSAVFSPYSRCEPRALSEKEILATIDEFASGAARAHELGFDGVEIMGSEGYLLSQFMAPVTNLRDDDWGGDLERRMRFPLAVATAVREATGPAGAVIYRISGADLVPGGSSAADVVALASRLASGPADALNVGIGWHESRVPTVQSGVPHGAWAPWAAAVRAAVDVPVIASNRVNTAGMADELIGDGLCDFVSMARPFLADPQFVARSRGARRLNRCIACNQCIDQSIFDRRVSCAVNPRAGYELAAAVDGGGSRVAVDGGGSRVAVDGGGSRVAVVGGGPAGMEAARALAVSGFRVSLFEAAQRLGGQFRMACRIPGKEDFAATGAYFEDELARLDVSLTLGARVDADALAAYDAVVVATGVVPRRVPLPGAELPHVLSYAELLLADEPRALVGERVAIIGAGGIGTDVAHLLSAGEESFYERYGLTPPGATAQIRAIGRNWPAASRRLAQITLMRRAGRIGDGVGASTRWVVVQELQRAGVELLTGVEYERIEPDAVVISVGGSKRRIAADTVVIAAGQEAERSLADALSARGQAHVVIGGAAAAEHLDAGRAFRDGFGAPAAVQHVLALV